MHLRLFLFLALAALIPQRANAQLPLTRNGLKLDSAAFAHLQKRINIEERVRIRTTRGEYVVTQPQLTLDSIFSRNDTSGTPGQAFDLQGVTNIEVPRNGARRGATYGATLLGFLGALAGMGVMKGIAGIGTGPSAEDYLDAVLIGAAAGAGAGVLIGATIGSSRTSWKLVFPLH